MNLNSCKETTGVPFRNYHINRLTKLLYLQGRYYKDEFND